MIVSHKHKFIFLRPRKVGSTSIEINLSKFCGPEDTITPDEEFRPERDEDHYTYTPRNYEGFYNHMSAKEVKSQVGNKIWREYKKITAVRNPWEVMVSNYWWEFQGNRNFEVYIRRQFIDNDQFYFDIFGRNFVDFYVKFENLEEDYKRLCEFLGFKYEVLPRTKTKIRKKKDHYSTYYTEYTKDLVERRYRKDIKYFGYKFEGSENLKKLAEPKDTFSELQFRARDLASELKRNLTNRVIPI